jgi:hypothetical protein
VGALINREELMMAMADRSQRLKQLDVRDGLVARGAAVFTTGHLSRSPSLLSDAVRLQPVQRNRLDSV